MQETPPPSDGITDQTQPSSNAVIALRNRQASPLIRIPGEVRNRIYNLVFTVHSIQVCFTTSHVTRAIDNCGYPSSTPRSFSHFHYSQSQLALLATCRQIYCETRLLPFLHNTFHGFPEAVVAALFPGRLYYLQLASITRVEIIVHERDVQTWEDHRNELYESVLDRALYTVCALPQILTFKVIWEGQFIDTVRWERFVDGMGLTVRQFRQAFGTPTWQII